MMATSGIGRAGAHHGEILQGVFRVDGAFLRGLVTLPCPRFESEATVVLVPRPEIDLAPAWKVKARRAARLTLDALGLHEMGARIVVQGAIPVSRGFGSSTSDVVATVRAICSAVGSRLDEAEVAKLAVQSESASDPLMFDRAVLFAQRDGVVLDDFTIPLPVFEVLGFSTAEREVGVPTLDLPPASYSMAEAEDFEELRLQLRAGVAHGDVDALGLVATASARINQCHLAVAGFDDLIRMAPDVGAAGLQVAHSGDVAGLLFDPNDADLETRLGEAQMLLAAARISKSWRFRSG